MKPIRIVLAEDHETVRQGLRLLLEAQPGMQVVGEAGNGREALAQCASLHPDIVVMDVTMPEINGLAATREIRAKHERIAVVALTRHIDEAYVQELLNAGAAAYVLKQSDSSQLIRAIHAAAEGRLYLDDAVAAGVTRDYLRKHARPATHIAMVSDRESEVLRQIAWGFSNKEIAQALDLSIKTVEVHKANATRKLGLRGRIDIVRYAVLQGWLHDL